MYAASVVFAMASLTVADAPKEKPFKPTAVFRGTHSQIKKERFVQALTADEWKKLWAEHRGTDRSFTETEQALEIDFELQYVVGMFLGQNRSRSGFSFGDIHRSGDELHLRLNQVRGAQFRPDPNYKPPEDLRSDFQKSKDQDVYRYTFVVLPKPAFKVVIEEEVIVDLSRSDWKVRSRLPAVEPK